MVGESDDRDAPGTPAENSMRVAILLTFAGGFLDAFTYVGHGHVFANAMTGNVVLLAVDLAGGPWKPALRCLLPILAFMLGVFLSYLMREPAIGAPIRRPALSCLFLEIIFLAVASVLPLTFPDIVLVPGISLVAAMQNSSFKRLGSWTFNSVMTTGNLRHFAETLYAGLIPKRDEKCLREARAFGTICFFFFVGAAVGAFSTLHLHNLALWLPIAALVTALHLCWA